MEFMQTQTCRNLARSFAGESQARQRYTQYADQARKEGLAYLARIFEETAANEQIHAQEFLEKLQKYGRQPIENIDISAGYPYTLGVTMGTPISPVSGRISPASKRCTGTSFWRATSRCRPSGFIKRSARSSGAASTVGL